MRSTYAIWGFLLLILLVGCDSGSEEELPQEPDVDVVPQNFPPRAVQSQQQFTHVSASRRFACGVDLEGLAWCWGWNDGMRLGVETALPFAEQAVQVAIEDSVTMVQTALHHACALTEGGEVYCWGAGWAEVGIDDSEPYGALPNRIETDERFVAIDVGERFSCGITADDVAYCWGTNLEWGLSNVSGRTQTPVQLVENVRQISLSESSWCSGWAITNDETVVAWGCRDVHVTPQVIDVPEPFVELHKHDEHICGLAASGAVYCAGRNGVGQAGPMLSFSHFQVAPTYEFDWQKIGENRTFTTITTGERHSCALDETGTAYCWGFNEQSQLGTPDYEVCGAPVHCESDPFFGSGCSQSKKACQRNPVRVEIDETFIQLTAGRDETFGLTADGRLFQWGGREPLF